MAALAFLFAVAGALQLQPEALPAAPFDLAAGHQAVELREALVARGRGARLVLFVRPRDGADFERAHPSETVSARLADDEGHTLALVHSGYTHYRGYLGLVLSEQSPGGGGRAYSRLELEAGAALDHVRLVWLDRAARRVEDLRPAL